MATLGTELEKAQKTLAEALRLDTSGEGEESEEVFKARLFVEALRTAVQAAHRDTAAAAEAARAQLEATREAHAKELEELTMRQGVKVEQGSEEDGGGAALGVKVEQGSEEDGGGAALAAPEDGEDGEVHQAVAEGGQPITGR